MEYKGKSVERTIFQNAIGGYVTLMNLLSNDLIEDDARIVFAGGEGARGIPGMIEKPVFKSSEELLYYMSGGGQIKKYNPMNGIGVSQVSECADRPKISRAAGW